MYGIYAYDSLQKKRIFIREIPIEDMLGCEYVHKYISIMIGYEDDNEFESVLEWEV